MHPALKRILRDCVPPAHYAEVRVTRLEMQEAGPNVVQKHVTRDLVQRLVRHVAENANVEVQSTQDPYDDTTRFRMTLHALSPAELETLIIMTFEEGRKSVPAAPAGFAQQYEADYVPYYVPGGPAWTKPFKPGTSDEVREAIKHWAIEGRRGPKS